MCKFLQRVKAAELLDTMGGRKGYARAVEKADLVWTPVVRPRLPTGLLH